MEITAIIVNSNGCTYLESLWDSPKKAEEEMKRLKKLSSEEGWWFDEDEYTLETQEVQ